MPLHSSVSHSTALPYQQDGNQSRQSMTHRRARYTTRTDAVLFTDIDSAFRPTLPIGTPSPRFGVPEPGGGWALDGAVFAGQFRCRCARVSEAFSRVGSQHRWLEPYFVDLGDAGLREPVAQIG
jgi:hypothetical protein